jgi:hypothetical protein
VVTTRWCLARTREQFSTEKSNVPHFFHSPDGI